MFLEGFEATDLIIAKPPNHQDIDLIVCLKLGDRTPIKNFLTNQGGPFRVHPALQHQLNNLNTQGTINNIKISIRVIFFGN